MSERGARERVRELAHRIERLAEHHQEDLNEFELIEIRSGLEKMQTGLETMDEGVMMGYTFEDVPAPIQKLLLKRIDHLEARVDALEREVDLETQER